MTIEQSVQAVQVVDIAVDPPVVADAEAPARDVLRRMREGQSGCALICRGGKLCGIFTERDLLTKVLGVQRVMDQPISELMTPDPVRVHESDPIRKAVVAMYRGGFRNVPIVDDEGGVVNCVRHKDIIHFLVEHFAQQVLNLPPDPEQMPEAPDGG